MTPDQIPFQQAGIEKMTGIRIFGEIERITSKHPNSAINIQEVCEAAGSPATTVKRVFYLLLGMRLLKATFLPLHRLCERAIGRQETSVAKIFKKAQDGQYSPFCPVCYEPIDSLEDIEVQIIFRKPGAKVES